MFDLMSMMGKIKEAQSKIKEAQNNLLKVTAAGEAGGGMVKAIVNGKKQVLSIEIDPALMRAEDKVMVQDLVVAAINKASDEADILAKEEMKKATEGMLPNIPGMDLSSFMG
jgi:DNA-binding protein, YbaB/EbfC family